MDDVDKTFNTICRICFRHDKQDKMVSLVDSSQQANLSVYGSILQEITKVAVKQEEYDQYFPMNMCQKCKDTLEGVSKFILACEVSDRKLKKLIKFSLKQELDQPMVKEVIRQYSLFSQNFTENSSLFTEPSLEYDQKIDRKQISSVKYRHIKVEVDEEAVNTNYGDIVESYDSDNQIENSNQSKTDVDIFIDSIKKVIMSSTTDIKLESTSLANNEIITNNETVTKNETITNNETLTNNQEIIPEQLITEKRKRKVKVERNFTCKVCNKVLATRLTFNHHIQRHGVCKLVCDQCGKGFPINSELVQHQIHRHGARSQYECDLCKYRAVKKTQLVEHMRLHTGERPFTCEKCGLTFRRKTQYNKHARYHGERTIQCDYCPRMFFIRSAMLAHRNCHNRDYVYACRICNITYKIARSVKKHMLENHGIPLNMQGTIPKLHKNNGNNC